MFAAYSQKNDSNSNQAENKEQDKNWLKNQSFVPCSLASNFVTNSEVREASLEHEQIVGVEPTSSKKSAKVTTYKDHNKSSSKSSKKKKKKKDEKSSDKKRDRNASKECLALKKAEISKTTNRKTIFSNGLHLRHDEAFYEDLKGDKDNFAFPNMYFKNVARHHEPRGVLGLGNWKKQTIKKPKPIRYFGKTALRRMAKVIHPQVIQPQISDRNPLGIYDASTVMYIKGQNAAEPNAEEFLGWKEETSVTRQTALFNERLRENPHDTDLWILFVEHQNVACFIATSENSIENSSNQSKTQGRNHHFRAILERKISILDKAILQNPKSVVLITARLKIAAEFWDATALHQEWRNMLFINPMSIQLWKEYLNFVESYFEGFSVPQVLKLYANCIQKLLQMQQPSFASHQRPANLEEEIIDIVTHLCSFLRLVNWTEKSVSLAQALLDLSLKGPDGISSSPLTWLKSLWDQHAPRIGEENSDSSVQFLSTRIVHGIDMTETEDAVVNSGQAFPEVWHRLECLRSREQWQACSDRNDCDDEERFVSFADISQYLFVFEKRSNLQFRLVVGCLLSLGVPLLPASQIQLFWAPLDVEDNLMNCLSSIPKVASLPSSLPDLTNSGSYLAFLRRIFLQSFSLLKHPYKLELALWWLSVEKSRICSIISSSTKSDFNRNWKETKGWIKNFLKEVPSSDCVSTVLLYNGYANVEREIGNGEESKRILQMLLQMHCNNPLTMKSSSAHRAALIQTWFCFTKSFLQNDSKKCDHDLALNYLVDLGAGSNFSAHPNSSTPAMLLKVKKKYEATLQDVTESKSNFTTESTLFNQPDEVVELLGCYAYFLSLTDGCRAACEMIQRWLLSSQRSDVEFISENRYKADFLSYHARREAVYLILLELLSFCRGWVKDVQPRLFYDSLCTALNEYPQSMQLLSVLIKSEERCSMFSGLWNNLTTRAKLGNKSSSRAALAACLALASREETIKRGEEKASEEWTGHSGGIATLHLGYRRKLENFAEDCVAQYPSRHVPVLWRILMHSAYIVGNSQRCKALFYRAVRDCPTSKEICMDVIRYLPSSLKEVLSFMIEKDLRLRLPLEELQVLLEAEKEEDLDELPQHLTTKPFTTNVTEYLEENANVSEESEENFSDDFQHESDDGDGKM